MSRVARRQVPRQHDVTRLGELTGPYEVAYLPYNRLEDGTVHDW